MHSEESHKGEKRMFTFHRKSPTRDKSALSQIPEEKYTFAKKFTIPKSQQYLPGSIEEDLIKGSDNYFSWNPEVVNKKTFGPAYDTNGTLLPWSIAGTVKMFEKEEEDNKFQEVSVASTHSKRRNSKKNLSQHSIIVKPNKTKLVQLSDEDLQKKTEEIEKRINEGCQVEYHTGLINSQNKVMHTRDEHVLQRKEKMDNNWSNTISNITAKIKRPAEDSIINKVDQFREKIEKLTALELATPSEVKFGQQNWYMSLRTSSYFKDLKHYMQPVGNTINGLYLRFTENPNARSDIVRKPNLLPKLDNKKTFKDNPYFKEKMLKESKKINEIMSGKDEEIDFLMIQGTNKYKAEKEWANSIKGEKYWNSMAFLNKDGEGEPETTEEILLIQYDAKTK